MSYNVGKLKIDFSLKREIFFVVLGALLGGIMMMLPGMVYGLFYENGNYYTIWLILWIVHRHGCLFALVNSCSAIDS